MTQQAPPDHLPSPLRVAMVIQRFRPYFSGQGVQVEELCKALAPRGVECTVITAVHGRHVSVEKAGNYLIRRLRCDIPGVPATKGSTRVRGPVFALRTLAYLARRRFDVVHVHALTDALYAAWLLTRLRRVALIFEMTLLGSDDPPSARDSSNRLRRLRYAIYRRCDAYVAISPALAERYRQAGLPDERLRVIPQAVDTRRFSPPADKRAVRRELGLPEEGPLVIFVGSLIRRKGIDTLLTAWSRIHAAEPLAHLLLLGRDPSEDPGERRLLDEALETLSPGAASGLIRLGVRSEVERYLQAADVFAFPSRREGFGTVMVEAMACGLPCVVAEIPGITDFIFAGGDGIVVPQESPGALAEAVVELLRNPERVRAMGEAARRRAAERFAVERIVDAYLQLYGSLVQDRRPA